MSRTKLRQGTQIAESDLYDDTLPSGVALETGAVDLEDDLNGLRSQVKRLIHGANPGNWYDNPGGPGATDALTLTLPNGDSLALDPGMPVIVNAGMLKRGNAASLGTALVIGLVVVGNSPTNPTTVVSTGNLTLTTAQWDAITGDVGGLIPGLPYFLGLTLGKLTTTAPTLDGQTVTQVGEALTSTTLVVLPRRPVFL